MTKQIAQTLMQEQKEGFTERPALKMRIEHLTEEKEVLEKQVENVAENWSQQRAINKNLQVQIDELKTGEA